MSKQKNGRVYLVGAGPGDLGLVTLRAKECIEIADVIVYDHLANPEMLGWAKEDAEIIYAGKKAGVHALKQDEINNLLIEKAREGKQVVRLKGGDPFVFGRGAEEAKSIVDARIPFEIVPGITSAIAAPAYAGIPVTHRVENSHVTFFTGHEDPSKQKSTIDYAALAKLGGTQVMLMGVERIDAVAKEMMTNGVRRNLPVALVRWATTGRQETLVGSLENIAQRVTESGFEAPAVAVFGDVVELRKDLKWHEDRPLSGKRIVVTRTRKQAGALTSQLRALGSDVIELPTIRIEPPTNLREFAELIQDAHTYDWIVFTSANGVNAFFEMFFKLYDDAREIGGVKIATIGPTTAQRVRDFHLHVDLQPEEFVAEGIVRQFQKLGGVENLRILIARAEKARDVLPRELSRLGAIVDEAFAYRTVPETRDITGARRRFLEEGADLITFTSSSTVENFLALGLPLPKGMQVASIGPITSKTATDNGLKVDIEARRHDIDGLVDAIRNFLENKMSEPAAQEEQDFKVAMQQLSAEAEKVLPAMPIIQEKSFLAPEEQADTEPPSEALSEHLHALEKSLLNRIEKLASEVETTSRAAFAEHFKRIDGQLGAIRSSESVNQQLFDSLHAELLKYRDNFLHESLQKPFIHDLVYLYDHLNGLCDQLSSAAQEKGKRSRVSQWRDNLENAIHSLVEILHRFDVKEIEPRERVDRAYHRVISFEPADFPEEDGAIVMRVKRGFVWRGKLIRPEEVIARRFG